MLAGLALLASLLVALLLVKAGAARHAGDAGRRLRAVAAADALLGAWWQDPAKLPLFASGMVSSDPSLGWRTSPVRNVAVERLGTRTVRLEITDGPPRAGSPPLAGVEVVLPNEKDVHD